MTRRFFDPAATEPTASIASFMAASGIVNTTGNAVEIPNIITEKKEEPAATEPTIPATGSTSSSTDAANSDTPSPKTEVVTTLQEPQKVEPPAPAPTQTWQEVLKSQQPDTIFKELGFDDKEVKLAKLIKENPQMASFFEHWQTNGDVKSYLKELTTDYAKMPADEVMRHQLRLDYPKASNQAIEAFFKREIIKGYNLDSEDEADREEGRLLLEAKADKVRETLLENQQKYLVPKPPQPSEPEPDLKAEAAQKELEAYHSQLRSDPYTQSIVSTKQISFGEGDEKFNYGVSPESILEVLTDDKKWGEGLFDIEVKPNGEKVFTPNIKKQILVAAILNDKESGDGFLKAFAAHHRGLGGKNVVDPIINASAPDKSQPSASEKKPASAAEAMAKGGTVSYGLSR